MNTRGCGPPECPADDQDRCAEGGHDRRGRAHPPPQAAVAWLESGVHIKAVADLLGYSSIAVTGDAYGHASDTTARAAVDVLSDELGLLDL